MLKDGVIKPSTSPWCSPLFFRPKPDGSLRPIVDFQKVNAVTRTEVYPIPQMQDHFDALGGATLFSTLDLKSGYWQIPLDEDSKEKTAFSCQLCHFEFIVLPFCF